MRQKLFFGDDGGDAPVARRGGRPAELEGDVLGALSPSEPRDTIRFA